MSLWSQDVRGRYASEGTFDPATALEALNDGLGIRRLLVEGGGASESALLQAGLVDKLSLVIASSVEGVPGKPAVFDIHREPGALNVMGMALESCKVLEGRFVWLRYASRGVHNQCELALNRGLKSQ